MYKEESIISEFYVKTTNGRNGHITLEWAYTGEGEHRHRVFMIMVDHMRFLIRTQDLKCARRAFFRLYIKCEDAILSDSLIDFNSLYLKR